MPDGGDESKEVKTSKGSIEIDESKCIGCGICVYLCPHNAISIQNGVAAVTGKCRVCGLCAASCITKAISMKARKFTDEGLMDTDVKDVVVFTCRRNVEKGRDYDATVISLLCSSRLDPSLIAEVFRRGARGVVVSTCGENCRNYPGSREAENKAKLVKIILEKIGESADRIKVVHGKFDEAVEEIRAANFGKVDRADVIKEVTLNRDIRAIIARMRGIVEEGNVYGERVDYDRYLKVLSDAVDRAIKMAIVAGSIGEGARISEIVKRTGLSYDDVMEATLEMKRRGLVEVNVQDEIMLVRC